MSWQGNNKSKWSGVTARTLRSIYGSKSPLLLFREKAVEIRQTTRVKGPAFDPFQYAAQLGIRVEELDNMSIDGLLKCEGGQYVVQLKKDVFDLRKNFTLAHEIAHTFFY